MGERFSVYRNDGVGVIQIIDNNTDIGYLQLDDKISNELCNLLNLQDSLVEDCLKVIDYLVENCTEYTSREECLYDLESKNLIELGE